MIDANDSPQPSADGAEKVLSTRELPTARAVSSPFSFSVSKSTSGPVDRFVGW